MSKIIKKTGVLSGLKSNVGKRRSEPLWTGPCGEGPNGGITQSMINTLLVCKERGRVKYIEGLQPSLDFSPRMEYGQLWHTCEEALAKNSKKLKYPYIDNPWEAPLKSYAQRLCLLHPLSQEEIEKWYNVCKVQFSIYVDYWSKHTEVVTRTPLLQEQTFDIPYTLPSSRVVRLRGKFDSVDLIDQGKSGGIYLQENKTKGEINEIQMQRQLKFDLQTMLYLIALKEGQHGINAVQSWPEQFNDYNVKGVRYNVIRRPLSGGKGSIKQLQGSKNKPAETKQEYYSRLQQYFIDDPEYWFMRWKVEISDKDIEKFKLKFLNPFLEHVCDWYDFITTGKIVKTSSNSLHWVTPYGLYNILAEGGTTEYDSYLETGNEIGLTRIDKLFKELQYCTLVSV